MLRVPHTKKGPADAGPFDFWGNGSGRAYLLTAMKAMISA
jgi:hypothetical protein